MTESKDIDFFTHLEWNNTTEELLLSWADIAMCYTWIYDQAYRHLDNLNYRFTMPIIILSTITGTISIGINSLLPSDYVDTGQKVVGAINLITGIMTTIQNYRRYAQQVEANLTATNDWARLHRNIRIELSIEREFRKPAVDFVKSARQEYERLLNARPIIETAVLNDFRKEIKDSDIIKPEILETVEHTLLDRTKNIIELYKKPKDKKPGFITRFRNSIGRNSIDLNTSDSPIKLSTYPISSYSPTKSQQITNISPQESPQDKLTHIRENIYNKDNINKISINPEENSIHSRSFSKGENNIIININKNQYEDEDEFKVNIHEN